MRKKSIKKVAHDFQAHAREIEQFAAKCVGVLGKREVSWAHDLSVIRLYREFETLMREALVGVINNDPTTVSATLGLKLPRHLTNEVCEYLVMTDGYFDFKGRDGLIQQLKRFVPDSHYLVQIVKQPKYKESVERLCALRNFAAHNSRKAKSAALVSVRQTRMGSAGSWLKGRGRLDRLINSLNALASEIETSAPY